MSGANDKTTFERLRPYLEHAAPGSTITEDTEIVAGLGLDSVKVLDLIMEIEDEFDVSIPMNKLADVRTVRDLAAAIESLEAPDA